jgi:hypothetical protein
MSFRSIFVAVLAAGTPALAQQLDPRAYSVSPTGVNIVSLGYGRSSGDLSFDPALPIDRSSAQINHLVAGYFRSIDVLGRSANVGAAVPYPFGHLQGYYRGEFTQIYRSGLADSYARFSINLYGAKALNLKEFAGYRQRTNIGASVIVSAPTGQYDPGKAINLGANRWAFKPEVGISHAFRKTRFILDAYSGVWLYTANHNFLGQTRTQRPILSNQMHLSYDIRPRLWVAVNANFFRGGQTEIGGVRNNDLQSNSRVGATISVPVSRRQSLKWAYSVGAYTTIGGKYRTISFAYLYLWGGGL